MDEQTREPLRLGYHAPGPLPTWVANPFTLAGVMGMFAGLFIPPAIVIWDRWLDGVTRVPRLWYQQVWLEAVALLSLLALMCVGSRCRFGAGFVLGVLAAAGLLTVNVMIQAMFRRGVLFYG